MKPWREIAHPHPDVLEGTFQQSEFAADITAVHTGKATREYQDAAAFFQRTFITEGMRLLLTSVAKRLNGQGGDPVIQLQTAFGGGKTHTMLAVYHLATRSCPLKDLVGVPALLDQARLMDVPRSRIAVIDGTNLAPGQPWKQGAWTVQTLWGELAWQLGGEDGLALVKEADATGTSPGKDVIKTLLERHAPCVILIDELVAYIRQFPESQQISGGSYDTNLSFVQALTEAVKLVPNAILLASLPESEVEAGSHRGVAALKALEKTFARVQALWKPVAREEAFEIVRRRLFEPVNDIATRDEVCRAFARTYLTEGAKLPGETRETRYLNRLVQAYPIHPEVFDRLYEDWTTMEAFQRTRGVLKLMAKVIYRLWKDNNADLLILPGSLPLYEGATRNELIYYLAPGWDAVLDKDIDGDRAETTGLETSEPRFGEINAARRVARTLFLGSAPASAATATGSAKPGIRGLDRARVLLGCLQPGQTASTYTDALGRLADRLHYLNASGDKTQDSTRFWFDTRANLRREMEDRKGRFNDLNEVQGKIAETLRKLAGSGGDFDGVHVFTPHDDVPDDSALRLCFLSPGKYYTKGEPRLAFDEVSEFVRNNGTRPRHRGNRLLFIAPDQGALSRLRDCIRTALAWASITGDVREGRLNIDRLQEQQAKKELATAEDVLPRVARECYKWLLCPVMAQPTDRQPTVEAFSLNPGGNAYAAEIKRICDENELIITAWSPIHLRNKLREFYWKSDRVAMGALAFWEDTLRYLYLPRLKNRDVLAQAIIKGAASRDFFAIACGQTTDGFEGFRFGDSNAQFDDTLLLIEPEAAKAYEVALAAKASDLPSPSQPGAATLPSTVEATTSRPYAAGGNSRTGTPSAPKTREFVGSATVNASTAKMRLVQIAEEIISVLASDPNAEVSVTLELQAKYPHGVSDQIKRAVSENANTLDFKTITWE
jgi:predicted AAA+ superfamily ATPase